MSVACWCGDAVLCNRTVLGQLIDAELEKTEPAHQPFGAVLEVALLVADARLLNATLRRHRGVGVGLKREKTINQTSVRFLAHRVVFIDSEQSVYVFK